MRCNTKQNNKYTIYYSASSLYMFRMSTKPITRSTQNCNYSIWYQSNAKLAWPRWREVAACTKNMTSTEDCTYSFVYS